MIGRILTKIKTVFINRVLNKINPTYIVGRRIESAVKSNVNGIANKQEYLFWISQNQEGESLSDTKKRVFAKIPPAEGILRDVQKLALKLLCELDKVCKENDINYFVMGGTIIGSVRHKGFIPWDNDIDIGMMRKDYDKLKEVLANNPVLDILEFYNFNGVYRIPKLVLRGSNTKLAIDIILFDYVDSTNFDIPKNASIEEKYNIIWKDQMKHRKAYVRRLKLFRLEALNVKNTGLIKDKKTLDRATKITQNYIDKCNYNYDDGDMIIWGIDNFTSLAPDKRRIYTKDSILPLCEIEFEGLMFPAPADYMDMIYREAGNIWSFPNDAGKPKYFNERQLKLEFSKNLEAFEALGINLED